MSSQHQEIHLTVSLSQNTIDALRGVPSTGDGPPEQLASLVRKLDIIHAIVDRIAKQEVGIMAALDALTAEVTRNTDVDASAIALLNGLTAKIQTLIDAGSDPAALQALVDSIKGSTDSLAAAVAANTPTT